MATEEVIELLKRYILLLNSEGISVKKAFLFGSYSVGMQNDASDIDLMIVSDKYDETDDVAIGKMWRLTKKVNTKIEPFLIGLKKFNTDDMSPLLASIKQNGVVIV